MEKYLNLRANIARGLIFAFLLNSLGPIPTAKAEPIDSVEGEFHLPAPGILVHLSPTFNPLILKGIKVHPDNPFRFDFILDRGDVQLSNDTLKDESNRLIKYFLASLTIPEKDLWVNLSPYEKDRIVPESFGRTEMGRDLLAEDYMLKQITASLIYPEDQIGKKFWKRVYEEASKRFGTTNIPVNTFNKVWIIPEKAVVYENAKAGTAYIVESKLKVMLEQDYLAFERSQRQPGDMFKSESQRTCPQAECQASKPLNVKASQGENFTRSEGINSLGSQVVREIVIPELTKEVNEGKSFAQLRQVYNSLILAAWYKKKIKDSILAQVYENKNKTVGVQYASKKNDVQVIYQRYLQAFKKGAYNYIKEEIDPVTQQTLPKKYFSGGISWGEDNLNKAMVITERVTDFAMSAEDENSRKGNAAVVQITVVPDHMESRASLQSPPLTPYEVFFPYPEKAVMDEETYEYNSRTRQPLNRSGHIKTVVYGASGADINKVLAATGGERFLMLTLLKGSNNIFDVERIWNEVVEGNKIKSNFQAISSFVKRYRWNKSSTGWALFDNVEGENFAYALIAELLSLGLRKEDVRFGVDDGGRSYLEFDKEIDGNLKNRRFYFIDCDITDQQRINAILLNEKVDVYFQSAARSLAKRFDEYIPTIADRGVQWFVVDPNTSVGMRYSLLPALNKNTIGREYRDIDFGGGMEGVYGKEHFVYEAVDAAMEVPRQAVSFIDNRISYVVDKFYLSIGNDQAFQNEIRAYLQGFSGNERQDLANERKLFSFMRKRVGAFTAQQIMIVVKHYLTARVVFYVEDEASDQRAGVDLLKTKGYVVVPFSKAENALAILQTGKKPDVIVSDFNFGRQMDGKEFFETIQRDGNLRGIQFVILSGIFERSRETGISVDRLIGSDVEPYAAVVDKLNINDLVPILQDLFSTESASAAMVSAEVYSLMKLVPFARSASGEKIYRFVVQDRNGMSYEQIRRVLFYFGVSRNQEIWVNSNKWTLLTKGMRVLYGLSFVFTLQKRNERVVQSIELWKKRAEKTILVVDNDVFHTDLVKKTLIERGYNVIVAFDGLFAMQILHELKGKISAVVSDLIMKDIHGDGLLKLMRQDQDFFNIPFIMRSYAQNEFTSAIIGDYEGVNRVLHKSASGNQIVTLADKLVLGSNPAMVTQAPGGIDLTPANMNLQTEMDSDFGGNGKEGIRFHMDPGMLEQLQNSPGFTSVIINIQLKVDLKEFLGINDPRIL